MPCEVKFIMNNGTEWFFESAEVEIDLQGTTVNATIIAPIDLFHSHSFLKQLGEIIPFRVEISTPQSHIHLLSEARCRQIKIKPQIEKEEVHIPLVAAQYCIIDIYSRERVFEFPFSSDLSQNQALQEIPEEVPRNGRRIRP